jgi:hydroxylamine dehydrogenase
MSTGARAAPAAACIRASGSPTRCRATGTPTVSTSRSNSVEGVFPAAECITCHEALTPGIVADWRDSRHSKPANRAPVACPDCHGADHQKLRMPTPKVCAECHAVQHDAFQSEKQYGFPSHVLAMERATDSKHFVDKPKGETTACVQCHSVATKCDSCHTRHRFEAAEARRAEACTTCHSGPPHPDDETYYGSAHGKRYLADAQKTDWSKPLRKGNYLTPTCAYCHMRNGQHVVADKSIWQFGLRQVNPNTAENKVKRERWIEVCTDCHDEDFSRRQLNELDRERTQAWQGLNRTERLLRELRSEKAFYPAAGERPPYPTDWMDSLVPEGAHRLLRGPGFELLQRLAHRARLFRDVVLRQPRRLQGLGPRCAGAGEGRP